MKHTHLPWTWIGKNTSCVAIENAFKSSDQLAAIDRQTVEIASYDHSVCVCACVCVTKWDNRERDRERERERERERQREELTALKTHSHIAMYVISFLLLLFPIDVYCCTGETCRRDDVMIMLTSVNNMLRWLSYNQFIITIAFFFLYTYIHIFQLPSWCCSRGTNSDFCDSHTHTNTHTQTVFFFG